MSSWQLCPIGPTGYGDSPYSSFSAFAGNPYFIDWQDLVAPGLVKLEELEPLRALPSNRAAYQDLYGIITPLAQKVGQRWIAAQKDLDETYTFESFTRENAYWLEDFALFRVLKGAFGGANWIEWPEDYRSPKAARLAPLPEGATEDKILIEKFIQYVFYLQWYRLKRYASERGIDIIGDLPIFVAPLFWPMRFVFSYAKHGCTVFLPLEK